MDYVTLGRSGLHVSRACLGAMMFGHGANVPCDEAESRRIIDAFFDIGGNFRRHRNLYTSGESEVVVGRAIKAKRDDVVLATKRFFPTGNGPNDTGLGRKHLTKALEDSLRRLGTDYVDLYQCHRSDADTPIEETMATLHGFVQSGKVRYIGCPTGQAPRSSRPNGWPRSFGRPPSSAFSRATRSRRGGSKRTCSRPV